MRPLAALLTLALLAACGADGPPQPPERNDGITLSGDARIGVVKR